MLVGLGLGGVKWLKVQKSRQKSMAPSLPRSSRVRPVEPTHFGRVELVEQHGSTRSTGRIKTRRAKWNLGFTLPRRGGGGE